MEDKPIRLRNWRSPAARYFELTARDLAATFTRVVDELHRQYLIGFVPQKLDGKAHDLEVRVKGEGLTARARRSYVAAR